MSKRVVITGFGVVSPVGNDADTFWKSLCNGESGLDRITAFDPAQFTSKIAGEVKGFDPAAYVDSKEARRLDRVILFSLAASRMAIDHANLDLSSIDSTRAGVIIGSGIGGLYSLEQDHTKLITRGPSRVSPFMIPMMISDMSAGRVSMEYGLKGPNYATVSACASGAHAIGDAVLMLKAGMMDMAIAGGSEATITELAFGGFCSMKALSTRNDTPRKASSPFDAKRDGFVMGEGAGIVVLETLDHALQRNATIYAELLGYGATGDAHHLSAPAPEGEGAQRAMRMALDTAGLAPEQIDYINAHGTSTALNDKFETQAIKAVFGDHAAHVSISSTKSMTGHLLGAAGAIECVASVMALGSGVVPPTINYEDPDPECDLSYTPNTAVEKPLSFVMSNSFGFGGHNAALIVGKYASA